MPQAKTKSRNSKHALSEFLTPLSFQVPEFVELSAWFGHGGFAAWLIESTKPRSLVELGTHRGFSYFAFCQAITSLGLPTKTYAVDHWQGDEHAGFYDNSIYETVSAHNAAHYDAFSTLLRYTFDDALEHVEDGSVDLLHIDGRHFYDDVAHDYESWHPKLSDRAVVLFHDTNVHERDFGVFKLWAELASKYPSFEFLHGHGLGVLAVGSEIPAGVAPLFEASKDAELTGQIRQAYERLGNAIQFEWEIKKLKTVGSKQRIKRPANDGRSPAERQHDAFASMSLPELRAEVQRRDKELARVYRSTSWKVTKPLRSVSRLMRAVVLRGKSK